MKTDNLRLAQQQNSYCFDIWKEACVWWNEQRGAVAYKLSGNPSTSSTDDFTRSSTNSLLLSIPEKPEEIWAVNENKWLGPFDLIARAAFINTSNKGVTPPSGTERTCDGETMKELSAEVESTLVVRRDAAKSGTGGEAARYEIKSGVSLSW